MSQTLNDYFDFSDKHSLVSLDRGVNDTVIVHACKEPLVNITNNANQSNGNSYDYLAYIIAPVVNIFIPIIVGFCQRKLHQYQVKHSADPQELVEKMQNHANSDAHFVHIVGTISGIVTHLIASEFSDADEKYIAIGGIAGQLIGGFVNKLIAKQHDFGDLFELQRYAAELEVIAPSVAHFDG